MWVRVLGFDCVLVGDFESAAYTIWPTGISARYGRLVREEARLGWLDSISVATESPRSGHTGTPNEPKVPMPGTFGWHLVDHPTY